MNIFLKRIELKVMNINPGSYSRIEFSYNNSESELIDKFKQSIGSSFKQIDLQSSNKMLFSEKDFFVLISWERSSDTSCNVELKGWMVTNPFILNSSTLTISLKGKFRFFRRKKALDKFLSIAKLLDADGNNIQHIDESKNNQLVFDLLLRGVSLLIVIIALVVIIIFTQALDAVVWGIFLDMVIVLFALLFINNTIRNKAVLSDLDNF